MKIFEESLIGGLNLKNRILMAPVKTALGTKEGMVTDELIAYYERRARGGVAAIISEPLYIDAIGKEHPKQLGIDKDEHVAGLKKLVTAIHAQGSKVIAHLNHAGRAANPKASGMQPESASALVCGMTGATSDVMSRDRIQTVVDEFGAAARRAREAGFDAIEVQAGLGYLLAQFYSERTNQRDDDYGQTPENRLRFVKEVMQAVVSEGQLPITARISGSEKVEGGLEMAEAVALGNSLEALGISALHFVTGSACDSPPFYYQHMSLPEGLNQKLAAELKAKVSLPVIVAGRLGQPEDILKVIRNEMADYVALGRPLVVDPDLPLKMQEGRDADVLICGSCLQGCLANVKSGKPIGCIVNPEAGRETLILKPSGQKKRVIVVGGGPAGLVAARRAAEKGHDVILMERDELGGQFNLAPLAPGKKAMGLPLQGLIHQAKTSGAEIRESFEADLEKIKVENPDVVILASGAEPLRLKIPGLEDAPTGSDILLNPEQAGENVLVIGGGLIGIEAAEVLGENGKTITVVEMLPEIARDMEMITRKLTMKRLATLPVKILTETRVQAYENGMASISTPEGDQKIGPFDTVVLAVGTKPVDNLSESLKVEGIEVIVVGDAREVNQIMGAVASAWDAASIL